MTRITRGQFLRFAVVAVGTGGSAIVACNGGTAATPGNDQPGGPLPAEDAGEAGGHRGPQKPDGGTEEDAAMIDADASDANGGGDAESGADAAEDAPVAVPSCEQNGANGAITANHGHSLTIDSGAFANIQGQQTFQLLLPHTGVLHMITLTDIEMNQLVAGVPVVTTSTAAGADNHTHTVTLTCA